MDNDYLIAKAAYEAYGEVTGNKNYQGLPMPAFGELPPQIQEAWKAACIKACHLHELLKVHDIVESGQAAILPSGGIVDRREHPEALPFEKPSGRQT